MFVCSLGPNSEEGHKIWSPAAIGESALQTHVNQLRDTLLHQSSFHNRVQQQPSTTNDGCVFLRVTANMRAQLLHAHLCNPLMSAGIWRTSNSGC